ncbi:MAG: hypothetical protein SV201_05690, partial [Pseudomonadota bacterium]|nr:hypothetical protein [Pseudomonadota bacterium]
PTIDAFLTTLGFTAFTKTLIDDADADTYWATLMASITKATARAELGVDSSTHPVTIIPATDADHILSGAENRADDRTLDATNWSSGHKLICDDANRDFVQRNPTPYTLSVTTSAAGTPAEVSIPPGKSMRVITRQGIGAEPGVSIIQAPVRQTVLTGPVDSNGRADFLAAGTGLEAVTSGLSTDNLIATWGDGFGTYGKIDYASRITSDLTFSSLTDNDTNYLYIDIDPSDGSITAGSTTLAPEYSYAKPAAPATGQYWYPVDHRSRGEYYDGAAWQPVYRLFLGEAVTSGGSVASVVSYVYQGRYRSDVFSVSTSSAYSKNHKIGTDSIRYSVFARESDAYNWALIAGGHTAQNSTANDQNRSGIGAAHNRSIVKLGTGNSAILIGTSANYGLNSNAANAVGTSSVTTAECYIAAERGF